MISVRGLPLLNRGSQRVRCWIERQNSIGSRLALRNITRDRVRLYIAVIGVAFAALLMTIQTGLLIGFATTSSSLIDHAQAELWIAPHGTKNVDQTGTMLERQKYLASGIAGVESVQWLLVRFAEWRRPDGGVEGVIIVGIDLEQPLLQPWQFVQGSTEALRAPDGVAVDALYFEKLGLNHLGETVEIMGKRARVVAMTSGIRTFTQSPYVFTSLEHARTLAGLSQDRTSYLLVRAQAGANLRALQSALAEALPGTDIWTASDFSRQTQFYWLVTTGAGAALLIAAILGVVVGLVIVSQTLYSATVERIEEYATIRAMGARDAFLRGIIIRQSFFSGLMGYAIGTLFALILASLFQSSSAVVSTPILMLLLLALVTIGMCMAASLISIRKVLSVDPASVFR